MNPLKRIPQPEPDEFVPPLTELWAALRADDESVVRRLLESGGARPEEVGPYDGARGHRGPALGYALVWGLEESVQCLLDAGADVNATVDTYPIAGWVRSPTSLRLLAQAGADINATHPTNGRAVLHELAGHADAPTVEAAIDLGANVQHLDAWGHTALFASNSVGTSKVFVIAGADPKVRDSTGVEPLYHASMDGLVDVVDYLLGLGCDPLRSSRVNGSNPLSIAIDRGHTVVADHLRASLADGAQDAVE